jgi:molybdenum cofactor cytidylyltransferase|tara:strand:- start:5052 stop:5624 length:573 start_codon:yes stop_codon:yes gene_type:complete
MNPAKNVFAIVLAAGKSKRLGRPKALLKCGEKTLIKFIVDKLESINLNVVVITNLELEKLIAKSLKSNNTKIIVPKNTEYRTGNLIAGLNVIKNPEKILVVPIDRPGWSLDTLKHLLKMNVTCCPEFQGKGGHPLLICKNDLEKLSKSSIDTPLNTIFTTKRIIVKDQYLHLNIDTPEDLILFKKFITEI